MEKVSEILARQIENKDLKPGVRLAIKIGIRLVEDTAKQGAA